jgi:hypothetical protein
MAQGLLDCPVKPGNDRENVEHYCAQYAGFVLKSFFGIAP